MGFSSSKGVQTFLFYPINTHFLKLRRVATYRKEKKFYHFLELSLQGVGIFTRRKAFEETYAHPKKININLLYFEPILVGD